MKIECDLNEDEYNMLKEILNIVNIDREEMNIFNGLYSKLIKDI